MNITKGPWEVNERLRGVVENQHREIIATMGGTVDGSPVDNAKLIAAAPDLLDACLQALGGLSGADCQCGKGPTHPDCDCTVGILTKAIVKGKGDCHV